MTKRRTFTPEFKAKVVLEAFRSETSQAELCQRHNISQQRGIEICVAQLIQTLKEGEVHLNAYEDIHEVRDRTGHFITQVYHQKRPHSVLGGLTPIGFERKTCLNFANSWSKLTLALQLPRVILHSKGCNIPSFTISAFCS